MATLNQKGAIIAASVAQFKAAEVGDSQYRLTGVVTQLDAKGNPYIRDYSDMEPVLVYRPEGFTGKVGDIITVVGKRGEYKGVAQVVNGVVEDTKVVTEVSIADFLAKEDNSNVYYMVTGTVDEIKNAIYGNMNISADGSTLYLYGTHPGWGATGDAAKNFLATIGLAVGDKITVIGAKTSHNGAVQIKNAIYFSHTKAQ